MEKQKPKGGTEILVENLNLHVDLEKYNVNLIASNCDERFIVDGKKNVLWQHQATDQPIVTKMASKLFVEKLDGFVYVSNWQREQFLSKFRHTFRGGAVIKNAINPIELLEKPKDKIKLIYTSTPWRGLDILLEVFSKLNRDDVELEVYSSTKIYGTEYYDFEGHRYDYLISRAKLMKNVNVHGYLPNEDIKKAVQGAHIFAYPSIFQETSCLSLIEAAAAGCQIVTTAYGAIPETSGMFSTLVEVHPDRDILIKNYAKALNDSIDNYWDTKNQDKLKMQSEYFNKFYSWDERKHEWDNYLTQLSEEK